MKTKFSFSIIMLLMAFCNSDHLAHAQNTIRVSIENLQPDDGFFFTPVWTGFHDGSFDLFDSSFRATQQLETLAETGNTMPLDELFNIGVERSSATNGGGPIGPGFIGTFDLENADSTSNRYLSYSSMIIPSNDGFFGNGNSTAVELFDVDGNFTGTRVVTVRGANLYDSGTEENNGSGAAGFSQGFDGSGSGPSTDDSAGVVALHPDLFENLVGLHTAAGTIIGSDGGGGVELDELVGRLTFHLAGDTNGDGLVDLLDVAAFVDAVTEGTFSPAADINADGAVDLLDVQAFINLIGG